MASQHGFCRVVLIGILIVLTGCAVDDVVELAGDQVLEVQAVDWPEFEKREDQKRIDINQAESWLRIIVLPDGRLARFGHPHVIGAAIGGEIAMRSDNQPNWLDAKIDVHALEVDRPEWRAAEGFEPELDAEAIAGTRANMLSPRVLDAAQFPEIGLRARLLGWNAGVAEVDLVMRVRDQARRLRVQVPVKFRAKLNQGNPSQHSQVQMIAQESLVIRQSDFGIEPFSALGGGLRVADLLTIRYRIVLDIDAESIPVDALIQDPVRS